MAAGLAWWIPRKRVIPPPPQLQLGVQIGHRESVLSVAFSPDGRLAATGSWDSSAIIWSLGTGHPIQWLIGHERVLSVEFSSDSQSLLTSEFDGSVRLWSLATGKELRHFDDTEDPSRPSWDRSTGLVSAGFTPSGDVRIVRSGRLMVYDRETAQAKRTSVLPREHGVLLSAPAASPDGRYLAQSLHGERGEYGIAVRDTQAGEGLLAGKEILWQHAVSEEVVEFLFSPDGKYLLWEGLMGNVWLTDAKTGTALWGTRRFQGVGDSFEEKGRTPMGVAFSADSQTVAISRDRAMQVFRISGTLIGEISEAPSAFYRIALSANGRYVMTDGSGTSALVWDIASKQIVWRLDGAAERVSTVAVSTGGRYLLVGSGHRVNYWDLAEGHEVSRLKGHTGPVNAVAFSADDSAAVTAGADLTARVWRLRDGTQTAVLQGPKAPVTSVGFSDDGGSVFAGGYDNILRSWNISTRTPQWTSTVGADIGADFTIGDVHITPVSTGTFVASSHDGRFYIVGASGRTSPLLIDAKSGKVLGQFPLSATRATESGQKYVAVSPDRQLAALGTTVASDSSGRAEKSTGQTIVWSLASANEIISFEIPHDEISAIAFSPDSHQIAVGTEGGSVELRDVTTAREIARYACPAEIRGLAFGATGKYLVIGSSDGTTRMWDTGSHRLLATLVSLRDGGWVVTDPEGRYDASDPENSTGLYWQLGGQIIELKQLKSRFYTPNLLGRALGFNNEPLPKVVGLGDVRLWPEVQLTPPEPGKTVATMRLTDRGGGVGRVVVKVNGREIPLATRGVSIRAGRSIPIDLSGAPLAADGRNTVEVVAYDKDNLVAARGGNTEWKRAPERAAAPSVLHAIVAGVSRYQNPSMSLTYPAKDAADMARALEIGGRRMFGVDRIDFAVFASGGGAEPTKENLRRAFENIASKAGPNDVVFVYLAGHGVAGKAGSDLYYYLTGDARTLNPDEDLRLWQETTISSVELREWLRRKGMPLREVLVLDTCAAGAAASQLIKLSERRELTADQRRSLELLKDATGSHVLMGAAADKVSYEASRYGQGLLTYALLLGMRGQALEESGRLDVRKWFDVAQRKVPELAQGIGGIQQPVISSPSGQSFPIAQFTPEDTASIVISNVKPQLLRARVEDEDQNDPLHLDEPVRAGLRAASMPVTRGGGGVEPPIVYLDQVSGEVAGAYLPKIRYQAAGRSVRVRVRLDSPSSQPAVTFEAATHDPAELAARIVKECLGLASKLPTK